MRGHSLWLSVLVSVANLSISIVGQAKKPKMTSCIRLGDATSLKSLSKRHLIVLYGPGHHETRIVNCGSGFRNSAPGIVSPARSALPIATMSGAWRM